MNVYPPKGFEAADEESDTRETIEGQYCYVCKQPYRELHPFYDQLCPPCGERAEQVLERLEAPYASTVRALAAALELRDDITGGHAERVTNLALRPTERVEPGLLADPELEYGFLLHDLGKIGVLDRMLIRRE